MGPGFAAMNRGNPGVETTLAKFFGEEQPNEQDDRDDRVRIGRNGGDCPQSRAGDPGAKQQYDLKLVGVLGRSEEKARDFAARYAIPAALADPAAFLRGRRSRLSASWTPSGLHLEPALQAILAGKHLLVEKPLEINLSVDAMLNAAGVNVECIFQARFTEGAQALKGALEAGRFGRIEPVQRLHQVASQRAVLHRLEGTLTIDGGGAVINQSIHAIDLLQWLVGMPAEIFASKTRRVHLGIEAEDTACATLRFPDGAMGSIEATTAAWPGWSGASKSAANSARWRWKTRRSCAGTSAGVPEDAEILAQAAKNIARTGAGRRTSSASKASAADRADGDRSARARADVDRRARRAQLGGAGALYAGRTGKWPVRISEIPRR